MRPAQNPFEPMESGQAESLDLVEGYHGSPHGLVGDTLTPNMSSTRNRSPLSRQDVVNWYGRGNLPREMESRAWKIGRGTDTAPTQEDPSAGRPRVHVGRGSGPTGADPNLHSNAKLASRSPDEMKDFGTAMAAPEFTVESTQWAPPPNARAMNSGVGVQPALPNMNWHQFNAPNVANPMDATVQDRRDIEILRGSTP